SRTGTAWNPPPHPFRAGRADSRGGGTGALYTTVPRTQVAAGSRTSVTSRNTVEPPAAARSRKRRRSGTRTCGGCHEDSNLVALRLCPALVLLGRACIGRDHRGSARSPSG